MLAAVETVGFARLILWDPVLHGVRHVAELDAMLARGLRFCFVYSDGTDHTYTLLRGRERLFGHVEGWLLEQFPPAG